MSPSYLRAVLGHALSALGPTAVTLENAGAGWVRQAVESGVIQPEVAQAVLRQRYGDKAGLWSSDARAVDAAKVAGYEVVHGRTLSAEERETFKGAGLQSASEAFPTGTASADVIPKRDWTPAMQRLATLAVDLHESVIRQRAGCEALRVSWMRSEASLAADYNRAGPILRFNLTRLPGWDDATALGAEHVSLILHELAHHHGGGEHYTRQFCNELERLAGAVVMLAVREPGMFQM